MIATRTVTTTLFAYYINFVPFHILNFWICLIGLKIEIINT